MLIEEIDAPLQSSPRAIIKDGFFTFRQTFLFVAGPGTAREAVLGHRLFVSAIPWFKQILEVFVCGSTAHRIPLAPAKSHIA